MALITLQLIEGLERGRIYSDLETPVSIGREDDNDVRLNDERVSRFHAKIQDDGGHVILTDLESTNGTRVNGHPVQIRVLQPGDQLAIGRCLLIYGSPQEIAEQVRMLEDSGISSIHDPGDHTLAVPRDHPPRESFGEGNGDGSPVAFPGLNQELFPHGPPDPPEDLRPAQRAELSDYLAWLHEQIGAVLQSAWEDPDEAVDPDSPVRFMSVDWKTWQRLLQIEMNLAVYLRKLAEPGQ